MKLVDIYRCLCDETRLRMLYLLSRGPAGVSDLQRVLELPQALVSKHLAYLRRRGLVKATRHGQWIIYALPQNPPRELKEQLRCLERCVPTQPHFGRDLRRLQALHSQDRWMAEAGREFAAVLRHRETINM